MRTPHGPKHRTPAPQDSGSSSPDPVEEASVESFPASDSPSFTPVSHEGAPNRDASARKPEGEADR